MTLCHGIYPGADLMGGKGVLEARGKGCVQGGFTPLEKKSPPSDSLKYASIY